MGIGMWPVVVGHVGLGAYFSVWFQYESHAVKLSSNLTSLILKPTAKGVFLGSLTFIFSTTFAIVTV